MTYIERLLRRERLVVGAALALLILLAWSYVWRGAGMGMSALEMTRLTLFPHVHPAPMADRVMGSDPAWLTIVAMWWVMMVSMMTPGATPLVLLYGRVARHAAATSGEAPHGASVRSPEAARRRGQQPFDDHDPQRTAYAPALMIAAGYLGVWLGFSIAAGTLQRVLQHEGFVSAARLSSSSAVLSAALLAAAGLYQLSPLKQACLSRCRGPATFLAEHWRPGRIGAFLMGARHGVWCVGCCWVLMALLFVGGVMNIAWIAALTALVLVEKWSPAGPAAGRIAGVALLAWAAATLAV